MPLPATAAMPGPAGELDEGTADELEATAPKGASRRLLWSLVRPDIHRVWLTAVVLLLQQAAALAGPVLVAYTIGTAVPALRANNVAPLTGVAVGYVACAIANGLLQDWFVRLSAGISQNVLGGLRLMLFSKIQSQSIDFHERHSSGRLTSRATTDVEAVRELLESGLDQIISAAVSLIYISVILLMLDWQLGVAALAAMGPVCLTMRSFRRRVRKVYHRRSTAAAVVLTGIAEMLGGIHTVQAYRREEANDATLAVTNGRHRDLNIRAGLEMARYVTSSRLVANASIAALVLWGGYQVASGQLALGAFAGAVLYLRILYDEPLQLGGILDAYQSAAASLEKIAALLATQPTVAEPVEPTPLPALSAEMPGRRVTFEHVSFSYRPGHQVLAPFDLEIPAGQTVAVVGPTGAGKSTLAKLLARFYDPAEGRVLLDGVDLRCVAAQELRHTLVMLAQEAFVFSGSISGNIALGRPNATQDEIERAAKATGAHDFIVQLPGGYQHELLQTGGKFSAGQRQLIALSRTFLADPSMIILDEATSALDIPSERTIQIALRTVLRGRTGLVVAHRLSTVQIADRVLVMAGGRITEDCLPRDLTAETGHFAQARRSWLHSNS
ncbi:MAG: ABC transporter ATP-binding protein [Streptosporangiaceae bacterium]